MFNLLRMDLYRMIRSRAVYICLGIMLGLSILCCFMVWMFETPEGQNMALRLGMVEISELAEMEAVGSVLEEMDFLEMFRDMGMDGGSHCTMLGIVVALFVCMDFNSGYIKNIMSSHRNRWGYVVSKVLAVGILNFGLIVISLLFTLLANLVLHMVPFVSPAQILFYLAWAWLVSTAFAALIILICVLTRSTAMGVLGAVFIGSGMVTVAASAFTDLFHMGRWVEYTLYFNLSYGPSAYSGAGDLKVFVVGLVFLVLYSLAAAVVLKKQDI